MKFLLGLIIIATSIILAAYVWQIYNRPSQSVLPNSTTDPAMFGHSLTTIKSNQWYSNLYSGLPSAPLYAYPLAFKFTSSGVGISSPVVTAHPAVVTAPFQEELLISSVESYSGVRLKSVGDWHISVALGDSVTATLGQGMPFILFDSPDAAWQWTYPPGSVLSQPQPGATLVLTPTGKYYAVISSPQATGTLDASPQQISGSPRLVVALLPTPQSLSIFTSLMDISVLDTRADWQIDVGHVSTHFQTLTTPANSPIPQALFLHHYRSLGSSLNSQGEYLTLRGPMQLISAPAFRTSLPSRVPPETFTPASEPKPVVTVLKDESARLLSSPPPTDKGYFLGTWLGRVSSLIQLADAYSLTRERDQLIDYLLPVFESGLTAHHYDSVQTSTISDIPGFGSEKLNDHHFHYGYYIRTAAVLTSLRPSLLEKLKPHVDSLVADLATQDRASTRYSYVRHFNWYSGHSFADGFASFSDGNNQESTSEAINAWYSLYLWGKKTQNPQLEELGLYLYSAEIQAASYYWFNQHAIYPTNYTHQIASLVWGGKVDFTTWFSPHPNHIYGIQILPLTPASLYLKELGPFSRFEADLLASGGSFQGEWGDLLLAWKSYTQPDQALKSANLVTSHTGTLSPALYLHTLYSHLPSGER